MKNISKVILSFSLIISSSLFANNSISVLYPEEDNDSPDYIISNVDLKKSNQIKSINSSISNEQLNILYPEEDNDSFKY